MKYPDARIVLFARAPAAGRVKTRLVPLLGEEGALDLHVQLLNRQMAVLAGSGLCPAELWVDGDPAHPAFAAFSGAIHRQQGADLGERMRHAATQVLRERSAVVIIGSDCPALDRDYLARALAVLDEGGEAVLGPAEDGGYVLIGLRRCVPGLFADVKWGTDEVLDRTLENLHREGFRHRLLEPLADIDRPEDLALLAEHGIFPPPHAALAGGGGGR